LAEYYLEAGAFNEAAECFNYILAQKEARFPSVEKTFEKNKVSARLHYLWLILKDKIQLKGDALHYARNYIQSIREYNNSYRYSINLKNSNLTINDFMFKIYDNISDNDFILFNILEAFDAKIPGYPSFTITLLDIAKKDNNKYDIVSDRIKELFNKIMPLSNNNNIILSLIKMLNFLIEDAEDKIINEQCEEDRKLLEDLIKNLRLKLKFYNHKKQLLEH
jgi:hypothetical protein